MEIIYPRCCGLDVHKRSVAACVRRLEADGRLDQETRTFGTMTRDLLEMADWLAAAGVTHVAMEATGVYWKPIYNLLEDRFTLLLVNARHVKHVPGRKTDVKDCQWLAQLLQAGLLQPSFIPARPQREFRELTRHRSQLVAEKARVANRLQQVLEASSWLRWPLTSWALPAGKNNAPCGFSWWTTLRTTACWCKPISRRTLISWIWPKTARWRWRSSSPASTIWS
jgi:transposase